MSFISNLWDKWFGKKTTKSPSDFTPIGWFGNPLASEANAEANATFMSCVNAHARFASKIKPEIYLKDEADTNRKYLNYLLQLKPNRAMNAPTFWKTVATNYFLDNIVICWLEYDYTNINEPLRGIWPLDISGNQVAIATSQDGRVALSFVINGSTHYVWEEEVLILRREVQLNDLFGGRSPAIDSTLRVLETSYSGLEKAIKSSQFIRFLVNSGTNVSDDNLKKRQEYYQKLFFEGGSGIVPLSGADKVTEVQSNGKWPLAPELASLKEDIYQYQGITSKIVTGSYNEDEYQSYYESSLEPFIVEVESELENKIFSKMELDHGNRIRIDANPLQTATLGTRIKIATAMMSLPVVVPNDIARLLYQPLIDGGDEPQASLNFVKGNEQSQYQTGQPDKQPKEDDPNVNE